MITEHQVDPDSGTVTLFMANLDSGIALGSLQPEIERVSAAAHDTEITFQYHAGHGMVQIKGDNLAEIALNASKVMTRKFLVIDPDKGEEKQRYASQDQAKAVLNGLKGIAVRQNATHITTGIDRLLGVLSQAYRA